MNIEENQSSKKDKKNNKAAWVLAIFATSMLCFVFFILVPFYDVFCRVMGIGDRTADYATRAQIKQTSEVVQEVDKTRSIKVQFLASNNADIGWEFRTLNSEVIVHPGALNEVIYYAKNTSPIDMIGQAVHSVTPPQAGLYFHKTECFCFKQQPLKSGESKEMPLKFVIDRNLPKDIRTITISYTMFNAQPNKSDSTKQ
jgi:cytochrome c oxidase assembly protein subunit 11